VQALRSPARSIVSTRTGSTSGSGSREPRSDSSRPYKQRGDIVVAPCAGCKWFYSITSSAIASSRSGILKPSAFAVLRLTASSYLTGFCTGIGRLLTPEDAIDVTGRAPVRVGRVGGIGDEAAAGDEIGAGVDRRQRVPRREGDDQIAMKHRY